jgi:hypothetical protein
LTILVDFLHAAMLADQDVWRDQLQSGICENAGSFGS